MTRNIFSEHPNSVGETYREHMECAFGFGFRMIAAGLACMVHGIIPFLFVRTGSTAIRMLHHDMVTSRFSARTEPEFGAYI